VKSPAPARIGRSRLDGELVIIDGGVGRARRRRSSCRPHGTPFAVACRFTAHATLPAAIASPRSSALGTRRRPSRSSRCGSTGLRAPAVAQRHRAAPAFPPSRQGGASPDRVDGRLRVGSVWLPVPRRGSGIEVPDTCISWRRPHGRRPRARPHLSTAPHRRRPRAAPRGSLEPHARRPAHSPRRSAVEGGSA
jgi:hypothetical protein